MTISGNWDALSPEYQTWAGRMNALHKVGIRPDGDAHPEAIIIRLHGTMPFDVMREVTQRKKSKNLLVRAIVDKELGAVHDVGHPLFVGEPTELTLITAEPQRALKVLRKTSYVAEVRRAPM